MNIADIISKSAVLDNVQAASKRELVQSLSERIAALSGLDAVSYTHLTLPTTPYV